MSTLARPTAVVFGYHDVGVRCLSVLLAHGIDVRLVVTHEDQPHELIWFGSVAELARRNRIETIAPKVVDAALLERVAAIGPDFLFSFYYRSMLPAALLGLARRGALNMHGSLLPKYRGRVPVNWAVLNGERETGASLHYMVEKPDAGDLVDRMAVPILPDDTAGDVFRKVTVAAEIVLDRSLPGLIAGSAPRQSMDLAAGNYCRGRRPEDGRIDWSQPAAAIHDLVRAVAPPYPGASTEIAGQPARVLRTRLAGHDPAAPRRRLQPDGDRLRVCCSDGGMIEILELELNGKGVSAGEFASRHGTIAL
ncbi:MAG: formyltransferase [Proteobacteria bacterium]|nr:formyltransferase [Pseudomonadota bacterium]